MPAHSARGRTPNMTLQPSEKAWKFHSSGSNMSWTPSVHMGITISVQAWRQGDQTGFTVTENAANWRIGAVIALFISMTLPCSTLNPPGNTSPRNRGCRWLSETCWDRGSFPWSCSRPSPLARPRAAAGSRTRRNRRPGTCTRPSS